MTSLFNGFLLRLLVAAFVGCFAAACSNPLPKEWSPPVQEVKESPVLAPKKALQSFSVPPGFRVELVAAEPLVVDPVAIDINPDGRIWAAEMRGYMTDLLDGEGDYQRQGQVVVLEDVDDDGQMDQSTVFLDSLNLPRGVLVLKEGVLVAEPPHLWLAKDTDGDLKADEKIEVRGDYGTARGNPEALANSPVWGMDNWIHNTHYAGRFHQIKGSLQYDSTLALGQWGLTMDNYGRFYRTWNSNPLFAGMLDPHYYARNPDMVEPSGVDVPIAADAREVWPIRSPTWVDRGYRPSVLRENKTLSRFTAASAPAAYRGDRYPEEFQGDVFVPEPAGHLVRRFKITEHENGTLTAANAYKQAEFMASTDERFRPVNGYSAPDGTFYVVDMYKGVITWRRFITQYLKQHIEESDLMKPRGMGRIYRVVYEPNPPDREKPQLTDASNRELVEQLAHPNGWWRDAAQQLLVERKAVEAAPALRKMAESAESELARLHALWTLEGLGALKIETVRQALLDSAPHVRAAAVRLSEPWLRKGDTNVLQDMAALTRDPAPKVRLQLAASLGEAPPSAADSAMVSLLTHASEQPYLVDAVVSGLRGRELSFLKNLVRTADWKNEQDGYRQVLQTLAATVVNRGHPKRINRTLQLVSDQADLPKWQRLALLEGFETLIPKPRGTIQRPLKLKEEPPALAQAVEASDPEVQEKAHKVADRLAWPGKKGYNPQKITLVTADDKQRFKEGRKLYQQTCATCHLSDGEGQAGVALSLVESKWVLGHRKDLARIVLGGKEGKTGLMPEHRSTLSNEEIAAILTYVRNAWDNKESPISPSLVEEVRRETAARDRPWTEKELRLMIH